MFAGVGQWPVPGTGTNQPTVGHKGGSHKIVSEGI